MNNKMLVEIEYYSPMAGILNFGDIVVVSVDGGGGVT